MLLIVKQTILVSISPLVQLSKTKKNSYTFIFTLRKIYLTQPVITETSLEKPLATSSETCLRILVSTLTETSLRDLFLLLLRLVSQTLFHSPTETGLKNLFFTLLRLVSETLFFNLYRD